MHTPSNTHTHTTFTLHLVHQCGMSSEAPPQKKALPTSHHPAALQRSTMVAKAMLFPLPAGPLNSNRRGPAGSLQVEPGAHGPSST